MRPRTAAASRWHFRAAVCLALGLAAFVQGRSGLAHAGHTDRAPWDACEGLGLDAECFWQVANHDIYMGTCRQISTDLMCVRNRPIVSAHDGSGLAPERALRSPADAAAPAVVGTDVPRSATPRVPPVAAGAALACVSAIIAIGAGRRLRKT